MCGRPIALFETSLSLLHATVLILMLMEDLEDLKTGVASSQTAMKIE